MSSVVAEAKRGQMSVPLFHATFLQRHLQPGLSTGVFLRVGLIAARLALLRHQQGTMIGGVIIVHKLLAVAMLGAHLQTHNISPAKLR
jgi:hypothetical protein